MSFMEIVNNSSLNRSVMAIKLIAIISVVMGVVSPVQAGSKCQGHPKSWDAALIEAEKKQWPQAASKQPGIDLTGAYLFPGAPSGQTCQQIIWQECLEVTIAGGCTDNATGSVKSGSPLHHYILDYAYGVADVYGLEKCTSPTNGNCYAELGPLVSKGLIVRTTQDWCDKFGAENAVMFVGPLMSGEKAGPGAVGWNAVRTLNQDGSLVFVQNPDAVKEGGGTTSESVMVRSTSESVQCGTHSGFDPKSSYCKKRSYLDASWSFTPACCSANKTLDPYEKFMDLNLYPSQVVQPFPNGPNVVSCDGSTPARRY